MTKDLTERLRALRARMEDGRAMVFADAELLTEAASLIQRLEGERDEAISDRNAHAEHVLRVAAEAREGFDALEMIDRCWEVCGVPSNRRHLSLDEQIASTMREHEAAEQALSASQKEVERLKAAIEPFAKIAGPIKGEAGRPTYLDEIMRGQETEELAVTTIFATGGRGAVLWADDFREAASALQTGGKEHG